MVLNNKEWFKVKETVTVTVPSVTLPTVKPSSHRRHGRHIGSQFVGACTAFGQEQGLLQRLSDLVL